MNASDQENQLEELLTHQESAEERNSELTIVNAHLNFPKVHLCPPNESGYFLLALEIDHRAPLFITESKKKKEMIKKSKTLLKNIREISYVNEVALFKTRFIPPGMGNFIKKRKDKVHIARYDMVILIETDTYSDLKKLKQEIPVAELQRFVSRNSSHSHVATAKNIRKMGDVNHNKQGVFLFNFFHADDVDQNLKVWEYTAGWFEDQTGLDNSTLLRTQEDDNRLFSVINHCRWDKLSDVLPSLIFKDSFKKYVLANFEANNTGPIPILYKLA